MPALGGSWDRYIYASFNPITRNDPTGHLDVGCVAHGSSETDCMASTAYIPQPHPPLPSQQNPIPTPSKYFNIYPTVAATPSISQPETLLRNGPSVAAPTPTPELAWTATPKNTWALIVGVSGSFTNPSNEVYTAAGSEFVFGDINSLYTYEGHGASFGEGGNVSIYIGLTPNIESAQDWAGSTDAHGGTISAGDIGLTGGWEQGEDMGNDSPGAVIFGYAPGADLSIWTSYTYATKIYSFGQ